MATPWANIPCGQNPRPSPLSNASEIKLFNFLPTYLLFLAILIIPSFLITPTMGHQPKLLSSAHKAEEQLLLNATNCDALNGSPTACLRTQAILTSHICTLGMASILQPSAGYSCAFHRHLILLGHT